MKSSLKIKKKCEWCGKEFIAYKVSTRFCCKLCTDRAYKAKLRKQLVDDCENEIVQAEMQPLEEKEYLTPADVAKLFDIDRVTVYRYLWKGALTCIQFGGKTLIRKATLIKSLIMPVPTKSVTRKNVLPSLNFIRPLTYVRYFQSANHGC